MHQAPTAQTSAHSHPKYQFPAAGRSQGQAGRLERKVYFKNQPTEGPGTFRGQPALVAFHARWPWQLLCIPPMLDVGRAPKLLPPLLVPVQGLSPKGRSVAEHGETSPKQGAGTQGSWSPPSPHLLSLPPMEVAGMGLGMSPAEHHPLQP